MESTKEISIQLPNTDLLSFISSRKADNSIKPDIVWHISKGTTVNMGDPLVTFRSLEEAGPGRYTDGNVCMENEITMRSPVNGIVTNVDSTAYESQNYSSQPYHIKPSVTIETSDVWPSAKDKKGYENQPVKFYFYPDRQPDNNWYAAQYCVTLMNKLQVEKGKYRDKHTKPALAALGVIVLSFFINWTLGIALLVIIGVVFAAYAGPYISEIVKKEKQYERIALFKEINWPVWGG